MMLKGAAILLDDQPASRTINWFESEYADETRRAGLGEKAAEYIVTSGRLKGKFRMEEGGAGSAAHRRSAVAGEGSDT